MTEQTDRELLEKAASAAGYKMTPATFQGDYWMKDGRMWNPLTDDGDALRLAVKLGIHLTSSAIDAWASTPTVTEIEPMGSDPYAATRRAIVRAAASMGGESA